MSNVEQFTDIETDPRNRVCRFRVTDPEFDYLAKLRELAESNSHLADFEIQQE